MSKTYKHLFFDLDGTLARSRTPITKDMRRALESLTQSVVIVSGGTYEIMKSQLGDLADNYPLLGENGNHALQNGSVLWRNKLSEKAEQEIYAHIDRFESNRTWDVRDKDDLIENRGCQITYSPFGNNEELHLKEAFDPDRVRRKKMLRENTIPLTLSEIRIGGTTCFDYFEKGKHKGYNVQKLIDHFGWKNEECLYIGDRLDEGGNDYSVVGVIDTHAVKDPEDTQLFLVKNFIT